MNKLLHFLGLLVVFGCVASALDRFNARVVDSGTTIIRTDEGLLFVFPNGTTEVFTPQSSHEKRDPDGWRTSAWTWGKSFTTFTADWVVPPRPTTTGTQCLFWFNSFQAEGEGAVDILQPVLQFNCNGHAGWTMASWYGETQYVQSDSVAVNPGDTITGLLELRSNTWYIESYNNGALITRLAIANGKSNSTYFRNQNSAQVALEVYGVGQCANYPNAGSMAWSKMSIQDSSNAYTPNWAPSNNGGGSCNTGTKCPSPDTCVTSWSP